MNAMMSNLCGLVSKFASRFPFFLMMSLFGLILIYTYEYNFCPSYCTSVSVLLRITKTRLFKYIENFTSKKT